MMPPMPTTAMTTAIAAVAPVERLDELSLLLLADDEEEEEVEVAVAEEVPVAVAVAVPLPVEVLMSVASYTIRIPCALSPPGLLMLSATVLVVPPLLSVTLTVVASSAGAIQVQNRVDHTSDRVDGVTHPRLISPMAGQQVTVVMLDTPSLSWQAV